MISISESEWQVMQAVWSGPPKTCLLYTSVGKGGKEEFRSRQGEWEKQTRRAY